MKTLKPLKGNRFGKLIVLDDVMINNKHYCKCKCDCGNIKYILSKHLTRKKYPTVSCGCYSKSVIDKHNKSHGMSKTRFYRIWRDLKRRCNSCKSSEYKNYGGRGITYSSDWENFENFKNDMYESYLDHVEKYGEKNTSIDRIDVNGNYCKDNCRWATSHEQGLNRRNNRIILYNGTYYTLTELAEKFDIEFDVLRGRLNRGWDISKAVNTAVRKSTRTQFIRYVTVDGITLSISGWARKLNIDARKLNRYIHTKFNNDAESCINYIITGEDNL